MPATSNGRTTYRAGATPGGPITGEQVVPCPWQDQRSTGPMLVAGDTATGTARAGCNSPRCSLITTTSLSRVDDEDHRGHGASGPQSVLAREHRHPAGKTVTGWPGSSSPRPGSSTVPRCSGAAQRRKQDYEMPSSAPSCATASHTRRTSSTARRRTFSGDAGSTRTSFPAATVGSDRCPRKGEGSSLSVDRRVPWCKPCHGGDHGRVHAGLG